MRSWLKNESGKFFSPPEFELWSPENQSQCTTPVNECFVLCWFWITQKLQFFGLQKVSYSDAQQHSPIHSQVRIGYFGQKALHFMYVDRLKWTVDFTPQVHFKFTLRTREYRFMLKMEMLIKSFWPFLYTPS